MCEGPILRKLLLFAIPLVCSGVLQLLFNAADIVVVGKFAGDKSLAAVGATSSLINLLTNIFIGLSIGTNILVAKEYGAKKDDELKKTVHTSMLLSIISGIVLTLIGVLGADKILKLMHTPSGVLPLATLYLRIYFIGMTSMMIYNFGSAILRAIGDTKRPLYYLLGSGVVNVILNLIFVIVFDMNVAGVALATAISQTISAVLVVRCIMREEGAIRFYPKKMRIYADKLFMILRVGIPAGLQGTLFSLSNVVIQSSINGFGEIVVAGNSAASSIEGFVYMAMNAFYQAAISFTSQNIGAGKVDRIKRVFFDAEICVSVLGLIGGGILVLFANPLIGFYTESESVVEAGIVRLSIIATTYAFCGMMDVAVGVLRGMGYSVMPMIVSLIGACGFRLLWIMTVFKIPALHFIDTIYISYPISWILTFATHLACFFMVYGRVKKRYMLKDNLQ
ncbi:MAG: MATE family efflux transporter [Lachnospiraceae bacterium]|nr:MATE family efflux transporter [Lachnospiraceae bacterium]